MTINKKVAAIVAVALITIGGVAATVYIIKNDKTGRQSADDTIPHVDKNAHTGVVKTVSKDIVKDAFGSNAKVADVKESGTLYMGTTESETASYQVTTDKGAVEFYVDVRRYESTDALKEANTFLGAEKQTVDGIGDEAHYFVPGEQDIPGERQTSLFVTKGKVSYKFALVQKVDKIIYDTDVAKAIVLKAAKQANLDKVK